MPVCSMQPSLSHKILRPLELKLQLNQILEKNRRNPVAEGPLLLNRKPLPQQLMKELLKKKLPNHEHAGGEQRPLQQTNRLQKLLNLKQNLLKRRLRWTSTRS